AGLILADHIDDESRWQWQVLIHRANIDLGRRLGDLSRLGASAEALLGLGVEAAHLATIEHALVAKIDHAYAQGAFARMVEHADQLVLFQESSQVAPSKALRTWTVALAAWAGGDIERAFRECEEGIGEI